MSHRTVDRVLDLLEAVARADHPPSTSELAATIDAPTSSTHDLLAGLLDRGWLDRDGRGHVVGAGPLVLDLLAARVRPWPSVDVDAAAELAGLPAALAVRVGHHVVYTQRSQRLATSTFARLVDEHLPRHLLRTAAGRLLLALAPGAARAAVLRTLRTSDQVTVRDFERVIGSIRRERAAWTDGSSDPSVAAVAVPAVPDRDDVALVWFGDRVHDRGALRRAGTSLTR